MTDLLGRGKERRSTESPEFDERHDRDDAVGDRNDPTLAASNRAEGNPDRDRRLGDDDTYEGDNPAGAGSYGPDRPAEQDVFRGDVSGGDRALREDRPMGAATYDDGPGSELNRDLAAGDDEGSHAPLFPRDEFDRFRDRWMQIQTQFVDEPRQSVEQADELVAEVTERLAAVFSRNRNELERQWTAGGEVSTEDLRRSLRRYRSFFERLLSM